MKMTNLSNEKLRLLWKQTQDRQKKVLKNDKKGELSFKNDISIKLCTNNTITVKL